MKLKHTKMYECRNFIHNTMIINDYTEFNYKNLYNTNQRIAQFYELIFNTCCLLHIPNLGGFILRETVVYAVWNVLHVTV